MSPFDPGDGPLGRLARILERPPASLVAFKALTPAQLDLLSDAIERAYERRQQDVDEALARAVPTLASPAITRALRHQGLPSLRRLLIGRRT
jgi:hypothetical protein